MRPSVATLAGVAAAAFAAGCGDPARVDVTVNWTFQGKSCLAAGVASIRVDIAHELLTPNEFSCTDPQNGSLRTGAYLGVYLVGPYTLTVTGLDASGAVLYQTTRDFTAQRGGTVLDVDLAANFAEAELSWDPFAKPPGGFAPGAFGAMTCDEAQVTRVLVRIDPNVSGGVDAGDVPCSSGGVPGALVSPLTAGNHSFSITGVRDTPGGAVIVYQTTLAPAGSFQLGKTTTLAITADATGPAIGGAQLSFRQAGVKCLPGAFRVQYALTDPNGGPQQQLSGIVDCSAVVNLSNLRAGLWQVEATAVGGPGVTVRVLFGVPNATTRAYLIDFTK